MCGPEFWASYSPPPKHIAWKIAIHAWCVLFNAVLLHPEVPQSTFADALPSFDMFYFFPAFQRLIGEGWAEGGSSPRFRKSVRGVPKIVPRILGARRATLR